MEPLDISIIPTQSCFMAESPPISEPAAGVGAIRRSLSIARYSRSLETGVWYYRVDIAVHKGDAEWTTDSGDEMMALDDATFRYSVLRRYSDFRDLYDKTQELVDASTLPPFPEKEAISPTLFEPLFRLASSPEVLEDRRIKFQDLIQWIEAHPIARESSAFLDFVGQPPQEQDGYTSLKEYTAPHWYTTLQQVTREKRRRTYTMDGVLLEDLDGSEAVSPSRLTRSPERRRAPKRRIAASANGTKALGKRRDRTASIETIVAPPISTTSRSLSPDLESDRPMDRDDASSHDHRSHSPEQHNAQVESGRLQRKKSRVVYDDAAMARKMREYDASVLETPRAIGSMHA